MFMFTSFSVPMSISMSMSTSMSKYGTISMFMSVSSFMFMSLFFSFFFHVHVRSYILSCLSSWTRTCKLIMFAHGNRRIHRHDHRHGYRNIHRPGHENTIHFRRFWVEKVIFCLQDKKNVNDEAIGRLLCQNLAHQLNYSVCIDGENNCCIWCKQHSWKVAHILYSVYSSSTHWKMSQMTHVFMATIIFVHPAHK